MPANESLLIKKALDKLMEVMCQMWLVLSKKTTKSLLPRNLKEFWLQSFQSKGFRNGQLRFEGKSGALTRFEAKDGDLILLVMATASCSGRGTLRLEVAKLD